MKNFKVWDSEGGEWRLQALTPRDAAKQVAELSEPGVFKVISPEDLHESEVVVRAEDLVRAK